LYTTQTFLWSEIFTDELGRPVILQEINRGTMHTIKIGGKQSQE